MPPLFLHVPHWKEEFQKLLCLLDNFLAQFHRTWKDFIILFSSPIEYLVESMKYINSPYTWPKCDDDWIPRVQHKLILICQWLVICKHYFIAQNTGIELWKLPIICHRSRVNSISALTSLSELTTLTLLALSGHHTLDLSSNLSLQSN